MSTVSKTKVGMTTIQIQKVTARALQGLGRMGETYDAVILRLIEAANPKGGPHGSHGDESTRTGDH